MYLDKRRKGTSWKLSGRYGARGKRWARKLDRMLARDVGRSIERMARAGAC